VRKRRRRGRCSYDVDGAGVAQLHCLLDRHCRQPVVVWRGGLGGNLNDLWKYIPSANSWIWVTGSKAMVNQTLSIADEKVTQFADGYLDLVIRKASDLLGDLSHKYLDEVGDNFQEALTDPMLVQVADQLKRLFSSPNSKLASSEGIRVEIASSISETAYALAKRAKFERGMLKEPQDLSEEWP
jgi:hypothetical protein